MQCYLLTLLYVSARLSRIFSMYIQAWCPSPFQDAVPNITNSIVWGTQWGAAQGRGEDAAPIGRHQCGVSGPWRIVMILDALSGHVSKRSKQESGCELDTHFIYSRLPLGNTYINRNSANLCETWSNMLCSQVESRTLLPWDRTLKAKGEPSKKGASTVHKVC